MRVFCWLALAHTSACTRTLLFRHIHEAAHITTCEARGLAICNAVTQLALKVLLRKDGMIGWGSAVFGARIMADVVQVMRVGIEQFVHEALSTWGHVLEDVLVVLVGLEVEDRARHQVADESLFAVLMVMWARKDGPQLWTHKVSR